MTSLELGFKEYAKECKLSEAQTAYIFKRATEHPEFFNIVKASAIVKKSENLNFASELLAQSNIHGTIQEAFKSLKML